MTNENLFTHEGVTSINGTLYRKVNRKASVGEKVLVVTEETFDDENVVGNVYTVINTQIGSKLVDTDGKWSDGSTLNVYPDEYVVLEPIAEPAESQPLGLTEADIRNNPRQVIDLLANMALRLTQLESKVERLGDANEQAINAVARNVETWVQETERIKHVLESPAPWAEDSFVIELSKKVSEIDAKLSAVDERTQPDIFVKIAGGLPRELTEEERREL